jgi:hypothetical protein
MTLLNRLLLDDCIIRRIMCQKAGAKRQVIKEIASWVGRLNSERAKWYYDIEIFRRTIIYDRMANNR